MKLCVLVYRLIFCRKLAKTHETPRGQAFGKSKQIKMKWLLSIAILVALLFAVACLSQQQAQTKAQRQPLEKEQIDFKTPTNYEPRDIGHDPKTGKLITYDPKPRIELVDGKAGKYALKWIGYDGKENTVIYQRKDAIDVVVSASVLRTGSGEYLYTYQVQNLPSSGTDLTTFAVQNFSVDVQPDKKSPMFVLTMSNAIYKFREGYWISFNDASDHVQISPGQDVNIQLTSAAPPGLVSCAVAGGKLATEGASEELPPVLENLLPGYKAWPFGYTIGPVDHLKTLSSAEKIKYLLEKLPAFRKGGWMTDEAFSRYERSLKSNDLKAIFGKIDEDLKSEQITTEVFAIVQSMR
jgi:hypothetical protein